MRRLVTCAGAVEGLFSLCVRERPPMTVRTFYRLSIWLPLLIPSVLVAVVRTGANTPAGVVALLYSVLAGSLLYAGVPYAVLALWAMWWTRSKDEHQIRWLVRRAPFLMTGAFALFWIGAGVVIRERSLVALGLLGAVWIIPVAYAYIGLVLFLRRIFWPPARTHPVTG
jgi:hypothetical protein